MEAPAQERAAETIIKIVIIIANKPISCQPRDLQILAMNSQLLSRHRCISGAPIKTFTGLAQTFSIELQTK